MSVSGPCLWLPSPAASSHLSTLSGHPTATNTNTNTNTNTTTTAASATTNIWNQGQNTSRSLPSPDPSIANPSDQQPSLSSYPGYELMPPKETDDRTVQEATTNDTRLSRTRLEQLNRSEHLNQAASCSPARESSPERKRKHPDDNDMHHYEKDPGEGAMTSSDDGAGSSAGGDRQNTPSDAKLEKKKMKRFRLTHNQTRFLMSEFTRQAHPDAAHRDRLSKEIPGLTPRQVQVWFQNRRAKLKRLTTNDRERMLKSRALPDDFDTTQVLRTPFEHKSASETPMLLPSGLQRPNEDEYAMSPLSAPSAGGSYFSPTPVGERPPDAYPPGPLPNRPTVPTPLSEIQRTGRGAYPFPRSSSFSDAYSTMPRLSSRYSSPSTESLGHPGMPYTRRPMDYMSRPGMVPGYDSSRPIEDSVSPTDTQESSVPYNMDNHGSQVHGYPSPMTMPPPKGFGGLDMNSPMQHSHRQMPSLHSVSVSDSSDYRPYAYESPSYIPYTQANASTMSLPATFPPDTGHMPTTATDGRMNPPQLFDPMRGKFGNQSFEYANYL